MKPHFNSACPTPRVLTQRPTAPNDGDGPARREGALRASGVVAHRCESRAASSVPLPASPLPLSTPPLPLSSVQGRPTRPQSQPRCDPPVRAVYWSLLPHVASASRSFSPLSSELVEQRRLDGLPAAPRFYGGCRFLGRRQTCCERLERHSKVIDDAPAHSAQCMLGLGPGLGLRG